MQRLYALDALHAARLLRAPALALFTLVCACGDDGSSDPSGEADDAKNRPSDHPDAGSDSDEEPDDLLPANDASLAPTADAAQAEHDAGRTVATGNDAGPPPDVSEGRMQTIASDFCKTAFRCDAAMGREVFGTEVRCVMQLQQFWMIDLEDVDADCVDAELAQHSCYASASCEEQYTACTQQEARSESLCPLPE